MTYFISLNGKQFWAWNTGKPQTSWSQTKFRLDTSQMAGGQCECGAWDMVEDRAVYVSSSWRSQRLNKNE